MVKITIELDGCAPVILRGSEVKIDPIGGSMTLLTLRHTVYTDSTRNPIAVGSRVRWRGQEYTIAEFLDGQGLPPLEPVDETFLASVNGLVDKLAVSFDFCGRWDTYTNSSPFTYDPAKLWESIDGLSDPDLIMKLLKLNTLFFKLNRGA